MPLVRMMIAAVIRDVMRTFQPDDDAENAYDFHLLSSFSMVVAGRLRASSFLPFFPSSAPSQAP